MPASAARLFVALMPSAAVRSELAAWRDAWTWPRSARLVDTARLHVTLHFLGDVERDRLGQLEAALTVPFAPFTLRLNGPALWPQGIAALEPGVVPPALLALHADLARALRALAMPVDERPYRPHVTLARRAKGAGPPQAGRTLVWQVDSYALMASVLGPEGGYTVLRQYPA